MTLAQYLQIVRAQWLLIAAVAALCASAAAAWSWLQSPVYSATAQMFVTTRATDADISALQQGSTFTQQRVKSYVAVVTSPDVLSQVGLRLGLEETPRELAERVSASSPLDTVLIDVRAEDTSPARARDIANAVADEFTGYVSKLELTSGSETSPVKITVTARAEAPTAPDSPNKPLNLVLGLLVGLGAGLGGALLRDSLVRTVGGRHEPGAVAGAPVLSTIVEDPEVRTAPLIVHNAFSPRAEGFRQLRTNIRFLGVDHAVRSLVVTSSVAGEGKSTTAANLAIALAQGGEKVVLVDADLRRPRIAELLGVSSAVGLTSVLLGDVPPSDALQAWRDDLQLHVLASGPVPPNPSELVGSARMVELVERLVGAGYCVVVDSPPLLPVTDGAVLARITDGAVVVVRSGSTRVEQLAAATEALRTAGATVLGVLVNCAPRGRSGYGYAGTTYHPVGGTPLVTAAAAPVTAPSRAWTAPAAPAAAAPAPEPVREPAPVAPVAPAAPAAPEPLDRMSVPGTDTHVTTGSANGYGVNGHAPDGYGANGYAANGHATDGHAADGYAADGHAPVAGPTVDAAPDSPADLFLPAAPSTRTAPTNDTAPSNDTAPDAAPTARSARVFSVTPRSIALPAVEVATVPPVQREPATPVPASREGAPRPLPRRVPGGGAANGAHPLAPAPSGSFARVGTTHDVVPAVAVADTERPQEPQTPSRGRRAMPVEEDAASAITRPRPSGRRALPQTGDGDRGQGEVRKPVYRFPEDDEAPEPVRPSSASIGSAHQAWPF